MKYEYGTGGMILTVEKKEKKEKKKIPKPIYPPQIPHFLPGIQHGSLGWKADN